MLLTEQAVAGVGGILYEVHGSSLALTYVYVMRRG